MKKIFALLAATVIIASASIAQTGTDTTMHKSKTHKGMHKSKTTTGDSTMKMKKKPA